MSGELKDTEHVEDRTTASTQTCANEDKSTQTANQQPNQDEIDEHHASKFVGILKNQAAVFATPVASFKDVVRSKLSDKRQEKMMMAKRGFNFCWYVMFGLFTVIGVMHMYFLLYTFFVEPTNISMELKIQRNFSMPRIHVCQKLTRFLDPIRLKRSNITAEQLFALEIGSGMLADLDDKFKQKFETVDLRQLAVEYDNYLKMNDGSIIKAYQQFYYEYGLRCEQVFSICVLIPELKKLNCCEVFELVHTVDGPCFVSRENSVFVTTVQAVGGFRFRVKYQRSFKYSHLETDLQLTGFYSVGVFDNLVQTWNDYWPNQFVLANKMVLNVNTQQRKNTTKARREMLKIPSRCIGDKRGALHNFKEYSIANCFGEKQVLNKLHLLNNGVQCFLPYSQLMNPSFEIGKHKLCTLVDIFNIVAYRIMHVQFINGDLLSQNSTELLEQKCRLVEKSSEATVEDLLVLSRTSSSAELTEILDSRPPCTAQFVTDHFEDLPEDVALQANPVPDLKKFAVDRNLNYDAFLDLIGKTCNSRNVTPSTKPNCTRSILMKTGLSYTNKLLLRAQRNTHPKRLLELYGTLQKMSPMADAACLPLCDAHIHTFQFDSFESEDWTGTMNAEVNIRFTSSEVEISQEVNRLDWSECVSLIGGNIGMWNGWCALSLINLFALFAHRFMPHLRHGTAVASPSMKHSITR